MDVQSGESNLYVAFVLGCYVPGPLIIPGRGFHSIAMKTKCTYLACHSLPKVQNLK